MPLPIRQLARYLAQKTASNPEARDKAIKVANTVAKEVDQIAKEDDRAYAAGKALRRALFNLQSDK